MFQREGDEAFDQSAPDACAAMERHDVKRC